MIEHYGVYKYMSRVANAIVDDIGDMEIMRDYYTNTSNHRHEIKLERLVDISISFSPAIPIYYKVVYDRFHDPSRTSGDCRVIFMSRCEPASGECTGFEVYTPFFRPPFPPPIAMARALVVSCRSIHGHMLRGPQSERSPAL